MPKYQYVLSSQAGVRKEGSFFASGLEAARRKLAGKKQIIISISEIRKRHVWFWQRPHLGFQDKMMFTKHMATMLKAGIPVDEALVILKNQTESRKNRQMYKNIIEMIKTGQSLAKSLKEYDYIFSDVFINMIATGENSGRLEEIFEYLDVQLEKEYELRKKIVSAMIYPAVIITVTCLIAVGIVLFIMPKVTKIFDRFDVELPTITSELISFSNFVLQKPFYALGILLLVIGFFWILFRSKALKPFWHRLAIHLPVFKNIFVNANLALFSRTMNSLLESGVTVTKALKITANTMGNSLYRKAIIKARAKVEQGLKLGESLEGNIKIFPPLTTRMLEIGERTGSLEVTTHSLARLYERNIEAITRNLSTLLEPFLLVMMAVLVGGIAIAIILPIYQLPGLLKQ